MSALVRICHTVMDSLRGKDPLLVVLSTQISSSSALMQNLLESLVTRKSDRSMERNIGVLRNLFICHMQYGGASYLKSWFLDHGTQIQVSLLLCHLNTHAIALKVQCCDFVISVLELDPPGIKQQDMIASEFLRLGEHPKKVSSVMELLVCVANNSLLSSNDQLISNGIRIANCVVLSWLQGTRKKPLDPSLIDHVINTARNQILESSKGDSSHLNFQDVGDFSALQAMRDICTFANPSSQSLNQAIGVCIIWLEYTKELYDDSLRHILLDMIRICLEKVDTLNIQSSAMTKLIKLLEFTIILPGREKALSLPARHTCMCVLEIVEKIMLRDGKVYEEHSNVIICLSIVYSVLYQFNEDDAHEPSPDMIEILRTGLRVLAQTHKIWTKSSDSREDTVHGPLLDEICYTFQDFLLPMVLQLVPHEQSKTFTNAFILALCQMTSNENLAQRHYPLKSLIQKVLSSKLIFQISKYASATELKQLFDSTSRLLRQMIQTVSGKTLTGTFDFIVFLWEDSSEPFCSVVKALLAKSPEESKFEVMMEEGLVVMSSMLFYDNVLEEKTELCELIGDLARRSIVRSHPKFSLYCKAMLGFLGYQEVLGREVSERNSLFPFFHPENVGVENALGKITSIAHFGLLAWNSKNTTMHLDTTLLNLLSIMKTCFYCKEQFCNDVRCSGMKVNKIFQFCFVEDLAQLVNSALKHLIQHHDCLDSAKVLCIIGFVQQVSQSSSFRGNVALADLLAKCLDLLHLFILTKKTTSMSPQYQNAVLQEVFYLVAMYIQCPDPDQSREPCWHIFCRRIQETIRYHVQSRVKLNQLKPGGEDLQGIEELQAIQNCIPLGIMISLLKRQIVTVEAFHQYTYITRACMLLSARRILEEGTLDLTWAACTAFLEQCFCIEKDNILSKREENLSMEIEELGKDGNQKRKDDGKELINKRVGVYWVDDKVFYYGLIDDFNSVEGMHHIQYDDGTEEWLDLSKEEKLDWVETQRPKTPIEKSMESLLKESTLPLSKKDCAAFCTKTKDRDVWKGFPFEGLIFSLGCIMKEKEFSKLDPKVLSLASSLLLVWPEKEEHGQIKHALDDSLEEHLIFIFLFALNKATGQDNPSLKLLSLECIHNMLKCRLIPKAVRERLLHYPWNLPVFQSAMLTCFDSTPGTLGFQLVSRLLHIALLAEDEIGPCPSWLRSFSRQHHDLLRLVCENLDSEKDTDTFTALLTTLSEDVG